MIRNFINVALRQLTKNKFYSAIHIIGLSLGIAACLIIYNLVQFELSFDKHWNEKDQIYRITSRFYGAFEATNRGVSTGVRSGLLQSPAFEYTTPFHTTSGSVELDNLGSQKGTAFKDNQMAITEPDFFNIFENWKWLHGPGPSSIANPNQVILTEKAAKKFFGVANASLLGKQIIFRDSLPLTISAILANPEGNTDFQFDGYISFATVAQSWLKNRIPKDNWSSTNSSSILFVKLSEGYSQEAGEEATVALEQGTCKKIQMLLGK